MNERGVSRPPSQDRPLHDPDNWSEWWEWFIRLWVAVPKVQTWTVTIDPGPISANSTLAVTATVPGLQTVDRVIVNKPSHTSGVVVAGTFASDIDEITVIFANITSSPIDPASESYRIAAIRL